VEEGQHGGPPDRLIQRLGHFRLAAPASFEERGEAPHANVLAELGLDRTRREQIERLRAREQRGVEALQRAIVATEQELRREELPSPSTPSE